MTAPLSRPPEMPHKTILPFGLYYHDPQEITSDGETDFSGYTSGTAIWRTWFDEVSLSPDEALVLNVAQMTAAKPIYFVVQQETTTYQTDQDDMRRLEIAADAKDERAFIAVYKLIDWRRRLPRDFIKAIQLALAAGAHLIAQKLAELGVERYPQDPDLKKYVYVLAPPKTVRRSPAEPSVKANHDWLVKHRETYRGKWVALQNGNLLAAADSFPMLKSKIASPKGMLLTKVF